MTSKHTPGPWVNKHGYILSCSIKAGRSNGILTLKYLHKSDRSAKEVEANAHLIAAAPELLEACELAVKYIGKMVSDDIEPPHISLARIEQAIANATKE